MNYIVLLIIILLSFGLRIWGIDKPEGLWNDEYVSWMISSTSLHDGFIEAMKAQCHMPLYYIYLKLCMFLGGQNDLFLRITSLIPGVLSVLVMYYAGLQNKRETAVIAALITAISSFLIYYSQEVRLYSLLFLFSAFSLLYFLRFLKNKTATNLGGLLLSDFLIMFTHTIGFVFVFFQILALSVLLFRKYKKQIIILWISIATLGGILLPFILNIFLAKTFSQWWGHFSLSKIGFLFTDYFSPVLTNLVNAPDKFVYINSFSFYIFTFITPAIALIFMVKAIYKSKQNMALFWTAAGTILALAIAAMCGKLVFITKYSIEIYPILLFLTAYGAANFDKKSISNTLITLFCLINLFYIVRSPVSAPKMPRPEGHKQVADMLKSAGLKDGDFIITEYYLPDRFSKYFNFDKYKVLSIAKGNFPEYISNNYNYTQAYKDGKNLYKPIFAEQQPAYIEYELKKEILGKIKPNQSIVLIINDNVAFFSQDYIKNLTKNEYAYKKTPLMFLIFSYINNHTEDYLSKNLSLVRMEKKGAWSLVKFTKFNK